jgi:hypothetical protein
VLLNETSYSFGFYGIGNWKTFEAFVAIIKILDKRYSKQF